MLVTNKTEFNLVFPLSPYKVKTVGRKQKDVEVPDLAVKEWSKASASQALLGKNLVVLGSSQKEELEDKVDSGPGVSKELQELLALGLKKGPMVKKVETIESLDLLEELYAHDERALVQNAIEKRIGELS